MKHLGIRIVLICCAAGWVACGGRNTHEKKGDFTKIDSLTETYLTLQDSMLQTWNVMVNDENEKIRSMHELLHALLPSRKDDKDQLVSLEQRLDQLERIRFTQKTMSSPHIVEEYDFASNSLISELLSLTEADPKFSENTELQTLVDRIRIADQRVNIYRSDYDVATTDFNRFLEKYRDYLKEIDQNSNPQKRPLFQMASEN
jgi:hypothetical protein